MNFRIEEVDFDKGNGLVPAIIQDGRTLQVLMLGYVNKEALQKTLETGKVHFYSRSKSRLWMKGESSGNVLEMLDIQLDCDKDTFLIQARPAGNTCHLDQVSCFDTQMAPGIGFLSYLENYLQKRAGDPPEESYTARLMEKGIERIAQKVGEEGVEVALAGALDQPELCQESADLFYHLVLLLQAREKSLTDVIQVLRQRHIESSDNE